MSHSHQFGSPKSVLSFSDTKEVIVNYEELDRIFSHPEIQDRKVVILSVIGAFRGGKSFFLDYCLRFLYAHFPSISNPWKQSFIFEKNPNWMGDSNEPLTGFSWQAGSSRNTIGIVFWSDVFLHTIDISGEKIAIFVMDTQGLFDNESTFVDNSRIFSLGTLLSSIQVFNLINRIQEDQLQYLQYTMELSKFSASEKDRKAPFQNFVFCIRDWQNEDDFEHGLIGGREYLRDILRIKPNQKKDLQSVRETIVHSFENIACCLLPHPGKTVARTKAYDGRWSAMDEDFKIVLKGFIESLLCPDDLMKKKINSRELTVKEMRTYNQMYFDLFKQNEVPDVSSIYEFTVDCAMESLIERCIKSYKLAIYRNKQLLNKIDAVDVIVHDLCKDRALWLYFKERKMGNTEHEEEYRQKLMDSIDLIFQYFRDRANMSSLECDDEIAILNAALDNEKREATNANEMNINISTMITKLNYNSIINEIDQVEYQRRKDILKTRLNVEKDKITLYEQKEKFEKSFRTRINDNLESFITCTAIAVAILISVAAALVSYFIAGSFCTIGTGSIAVLAMLSFIAFKMMKTNRLLSDINTERERLNDPYVRDASERLHPNQCLIM
ncbi:atlastin-like [Chironomus tepperi]|uniref:atlastin-like n=1 Tax=Chironomus tepperi TaxID=113505 RepID=UPI00391F0CEB